jgi:1,4-dihydroxy-2-naphthoate octaprenyltransferase
VWVRAARVPTLSAAIVPVLVGSAVAYAHGGFRPLVVAAALVAALAIQVGTNYANDLFDHRRGADRAGRLGPPRVTALGLVTPREMALATAAAFAVAVLAGTYLVWVGGLPVLVVGLASILAGIGYTAGPFPLAYHALGDVFVFVFFGLVPVPTMEYLHTGAVTMASVAAAIPVGCVITAVLVVNNLRDIDGDRAVGKRTLAVLIGRTATRAEYALLLFVPYAAVVAGWLAALFPVTALLTVLTFPLQQRLLRVVATAEGRALDPALARTSQLHLLFGALLAAGLLAPLG